MNPYLLLGIIAGSTTVLAGIISVLVSLGVSLLLAFIGVYLFFILVMIRMMKSATQMYDDCELTEHDGYFLDHNNSKVTADDSINYAEEDVVEVVA